MDGVKAKQSYDALHLELCLLQRNLQHASTLLNLCNQKLIRLEDMVGGTFILESYAILWRSEYLKKS
jgi:E3 ubiquitin-protein ligase BRE1